MLDVRRLRALRELADRGTIAAAADALHLTASAVSQQLTALEAEVGQPLLDRSRRSVRLTPAADVVLRHADAMLAETERLEASLHALRTGRGATVRIGGFSTSLTGLVLPALADPAFAAAGIGVELVDVEAPECFALLARHELDVVLSMTSPNAPPTDETRQVRVPLHADAMDVALPAGHPLAGEAAVSLAELAGEAWIAPPAGWSCEHVVTAACAAAGFQQDVRHRCSEWSAAVALVGAGLGVSLVPRLAGTVAAAGAVLRPLAPPVPARHVFAACRGGAEHHAAVTAVLDALVNAARRAEPVAA
jgi:DNA-binding transcriptional LysR family regulator